MLVARHQSKVRGYLRQLARDPAAADDMAQDAFIRAWDKLETYSGQGRFLSWLMAIAHKQFLQAVRKDKQVRRLEQALEHQAASSDMSEQSPVADGGDLADLSRLLAALSEDERTAMVLAYGYGLSHGEINEITGVPLGTVKSHIHRGKERIRKRFALENPGHA